MSFLTGIRKVCIPAPAKINLFLSIEGKRDDGFHELQTILAKVQLYDLVEIELTDNINGFEITCPGFLKLENKVTWLLRWPIIGWSGQAYKRESKFP